MNSKKRYQLELIQRCVDEEAQQEELEQLEALLRHDSNFRKTYLSYLNIDLALPNIPKEETQKKVIKLSLWRSTTSAAVFGLVCGLFCATVTWAIVVPLKPSPLSARVVLPVLSESFEPPNQQLTPGFPKRAGIWGGDRMQVVTSTPSDPPLDGNSVLKLGTSPLYKQAHLIQVIDVASFPQAREDEIREIKVTSSFLADQYDEQERYTVRVASFKESPEEIRALREDLTVAEINELTLTLSETGINTRKKITGWKTLSTTVEVPSEAQSVVVSLGAGRRYRKSEKIPHYIDDVRAEIRITPNH